MPLTISTITSTSDFWQGFDYAYKTSHTKTLTLFYLLLFFPITEYENFTVNNYECEETFTEEQH